MARAKPTQADIDEFGEDDGNPSIPKLICVLPLDMQEPFRQKQRDHVFEMTGSRDITWKQYMNGEYTKKKPWPHKLTTQEIEAIYEEMKESSKITAKRLADMHRIECTCYKNRQRYEPQKCKIHALIK
jgi:hypothetical protein